MNLSWSEELGLDEQIDAIRENYNIPGCTAAIVTRNDTDDDVLSYITSTGYRRRVTPLNQSSYPVTDDDSWNLGSCGKAMTTSLFGRLYEQGILGSWDMTLEEIFPEINMGRRPHAKITVAHLLGHTSGLSDFLPLVAYVVPLRDLMVARYRALEITVRTDRLLFDPGTSFSYSNMGYVFAGAVAEKLSGIPFEDLMQQEVFDPLEMASAGMGSPGERGVVDQPSLHWPFLGLPRINDNFWDGFLGSLYGPAGIVYSNIEDWAKFIAVHLNDGSFPYDYLSKSTLDFLHTPAPGTEGEYWQRHAYGWYVAMQQREPWEGDFPLLSHIGSTGDNSVYARVFRGAGFATLVVCNQNNFEPVIEMQDLLIRTWVEVTRN